MDTGASTRRARRLSPRQTQVLEAVANGLTNKEIARNLGVSEQAVKAHVSRLLLRFHARTRTALVRAAARNRAINLDQ